MNLLQRMANFVASKKDDVKKAPKTPHTDPGPWLKKSSMAMKLKRAYYGIKEDGIVTLPSGTQYDTRSHSGWRRIRKARA